MTVLPRPPSTAFLNTTPLYPRSLPSLISERLIPLNVEISHSHKISHAPEIETIITGLHPYVAEEAEPNRPVLNDYSYYLTNHLDFMIQSRRQEHKEKAIAALVEEDKEAEDTWDKVVKGRGSTVGPRN